MTLPGLGYLVVLVLVLGVAGGVVLIWALTGIAARLVPGRGNA